jgi:hypothetical protein
MSLLTLPAFLIRRREDTSMPETTITPAATEPNVLMRFLTQGGATVIVTGSGDYGSEDNRWKCLGCNDKDSGIGNWEWRARDAANAHAEKCRAMPKPEA